MASVVVLGSVKCSSLFAPCHIYVGNGPVSESLFDEVEVS